MTVRRYDTSTEITYRRDARGFLRVKARPTRTGIFTYRRADGTQVRELRHPDQILTEDSLATLSGAPVTHLHPGTPVTPENAKELGVGHVVDGARADGAFVEAELVIEDQSIIEAIERGDLKELSCGYECGIDPTPGVYEGERYDAMQLSPRYNHVAIGPKGWGRGGSEVALRNDSTAAVLSPEQTTPSTRAGDNPPETGAETIMTIKLRLDGQSVEVSEDSAPVLESLFEKRADEAQKRLDEVQAELETARKEAGEAVARADRAEAARDDAQAKLAEVEGPEQVQARVQARLGLERDAAKVLGADVKLDSLSDDEVVVKVLEKARPDFKLDGKGAEYKLALFEAAVLDETKRQDGGRDELKKAITEVAPRNDGEQKDPFAKRRNAYVGNQESK